MVLLWTQNSMELTLAKHYQTRRLVFELKAFGRGANKRRWEEGRQKGKKKKSFALFFFFFTDVLSCLKDVPSWVAVFFPAASWWDTVAAGADDDDDDDDDSATTQKPGAMSSLFLCSQFFSSVFFTLSKTSFCASRFSQANLSTYIYIYIYIYIF